MFLNMKSFNGEFGCPVCYQRSERIENTQVYRFVSYRRKRTASDYPYILEEIATKNLQSKFGIFGHSILSQIPSYQVFRSTIPDIMHCVDLGVCRQFTSLLLERITSVQKADLSRSLLSAKTPASICRRPKPLEEIGIWKAAEFHNWLLYFAPIFLKNTILDEFYKHFLLLTFGASVVYSKSFYDFNLVNANQAFTLFVRDIEPLYESARFCSFNSHLLLHICDAVHNLGTVADYNAYLFESANGMCLKKQTTNY